MKRLLFTLICVLATGFSIAASGNPEPPPILETTTFSELESTNANFVSQDWNVVDVFEQDHEEGVFVLIKYANIRFELVYASDIVSDFTQNRFESFRQIVKRSSAKYRYGYLEQRWQFQEHIQRQVENGSSGGLAGSQNWAFKSHKTFIS